MEEKRQWHRGEGEKKIQGNKRHKEVVMAIRRVAKQAVTYKERTISQGVGRTRRQEENVGKNN